MLVAANNICKSYENETNPRISFGRRYFSKNLGLIIHYYVKNGVHLLLNKSVRYASHG
jgi:hypothetical protein